MSAASHDIPRRACVAGLALVVAGAVSAVWLLPGAYRALDPLPPDAATYLEWNPGRAPAYPLLLSGMRLISTSVAWIGWVQFAALAASAVWLALTVFDTTGRTWLALGLAGGVLAHPQVVSYAFTVLPESLFMSGLMVHLAMVVRSTRSTGTRALVGASVTAAALVLLKPSAYAILGCLPLLLLYRWRERGAAAVALAVPAAAILIAVSTGNLIARGFFAPQAQGGYSLVAHTGPFVEAGDARYPALSAAIAGDVAPHRRALEGIGGLELYYLFSSHDYHAIERIVRRRIVEESDQRHGLTTTDERQFPADARLLQDLTAMGGALARRAIADHPGAYVRHVAAQLFGLWMLPLIQSPASAARLTEALDAVRAQAAELDRSPVAFRRVPVWAFFAVRALLAAVCFGAVAAVIAFLVQPASPRWLVPAYAGLVVHANFLLVAAVQPGLPRYALVMWPAVGLVMCSGIDAVFKRVRA